MKIDRFVKVMLVIIAGLLFLNCFNNGPDILSRKAKAVIPGFMETGKTYSCGGVGPGYLYTVISVDKDSGWIRAKTKSNGIGGDSEQWVNTAKLDHCTESK